MINKIVMARIYFDDDFDEQILMNKGFLKSHHGLEMTVDGIRVIYHLYLKSIPSITCTKSNHIKISELEEFDFKKAIKTLNNLGVDSYSELILYGTNQIEDTLLKYGFCQTGFHRQMVFDDASMIYCHRGDFWDLDISFKGKLSNILKETII